MRIFMFYGIFVIFKRELFMIEQEREGRPQVCFLPLAFPLRK
jgi:hypothetical protein